jgi:hypothetical protein
LSPEAYAAFLAEGKISLKRDDEGNYIFVASKTTTSVLPRDIIEQLEKGRVEETAAFYARMAAFDLFISALKAAK